MGDPRPNPDLQPASVEVDRFEHVLASPERALLRLDGTYTQVPGRKMLEAILVVDDGESVRRHLALPDPSRMLPGSQEEDEWFWQTAFVVASAALRDQRTAFALEAEPGVLIDLPFPVERLLPAPVVTARGVRLAPRQAVALGLALTIALSSTALPALADTQVLNVHGPDGSVSQVDRSGAPVDTGGPTNPAPGGMATSAAAPPPAAVQQPEQSQQQTQPQGQSEQGYAQDATTPTPASDSQTPVQEGTSKSGGGVRQEHPGSGHKRHSGSGGRHHDSAPVGHHV